MRLLPLNRLSETKKFNAIIGNFELYCRKIKNYTMKKIICSSLLFGLIACTSNAPKDTKELMAEVTSEEVKIPTAEKGFNAYETEETWIMYPENWSIDTSESGGINYFIYSPLVEATDVFQENFNLATEKLPNNSITTEYYTNRALEMIKTSFTDFKLLENKEHKGNAGTYRTIVYTASMSGMNLKWKQSVYIKNSTAYIVSITTLEDTFKEFDAMSQKVMNSFFIK